MTNLNIIFYVVMSVIDSLKFETRPSSVMNLGPANNDNITQYKDGPNTYVSGDSYR